MNLEEYKSQFVRVLEDSRTLNWIQGEIIAQAITQFGTSVLSDFASLAHRSTMWARQVAQVAMTFPEDKRYPDLPWSFYLKVLQRAHKLKMDPLELLEKAVAEEASEKDIVKIGTDSEEIKMHKVCPCGVKINFTCPPTMAGMEIHCPICGEKLGIVEEV